MKLVVDRPWANILTIETGKGKGKEVMAKASWGEDKDPLPRYVEVAVNEDGELIIGRIDGPFESISQAEQLALEKATRWYDKQA